MSTLWKLLKTMFVPQLNFILMRTVIHTFMYQYLFQGNMQLNRIQQKYLISTFMEKNWNLTFLHINGNLTDMLIYNSVTKLCEYNLNHYLLTWRLLRPKLSQFHLRSSNINRSCSWLCCNWQSMGRWGICRSQSINYSMCCTNQCRF